MALSPEAIKYQTEHIHEDRTPQFIASVSVVVGLATFAVALRLIARYMAKIRLEADDYTIVFALFIAWGIFVANMFEAKHGQGKHMLAVPIEDLVTYAKAFYAADLAYPCAILLTQFSFLLFYKRVFTFQRPAFKYAVLGVAAFAVACWAASFFATLFHCIPIEYNWDRMIPGRCINPAALFISGLALNLFTDCCIILLPIPMIWRIQISRTEKLALSGIFLLGGFVCIGNLIRLPYLISVDQEDLTWSLAGGVVWSTAEVSIGILSACLPCFRPFLRMVKKSLSTWASRASRSRTYDPNLSHSLVSGRHEWNVLPKDGQSGQSLGVKSEIHSIAAGDVPLSDLERAEPNKSIGVQREVFVTTKELGS